MAQNRLKRIIWVTMDLCFAIYKAKYDTKYIYLRSPLLLLEHSDSGVRGAKEGMLPHIITVHLAIKVQK